METNRTTARTRIVAAALSVTLAGCGLLTGTQQVFADEGSPEAQPAADQAATGQAADTPEETSGTEATPAPSSISATSLTADQIDTRMAPNPDQGFLRDKQTSLAFPNLRVGSTIVYTLRERYAGIPSATQFHYVLGLQPRAVRQERSRAAVSYTHLRTGTSACSTTATRAPTTAAS